MAAPGAPPAGHLFPYVPNQPGYNKRLRTLAPTICRVLRELVAASASVCDQVRLLDSTPVPCAASRETVKRSDLAGHAAYGYCASHSRYFWGFRLYLLSTPDGLPVDFALVPPTNPNARSPRPCSTASRCVPARCWSPTKASPAPTSKPSSPPMGATLVRPDRRNEPRRFGNLGGMRQWIESIIDTAKGQLGLERHGGRTLDGLFARVSQRVAALAAALWFNWQLHTPGRPLTNYDH